MVIQNLSVLEEEHVCPNCKTKLSCCEAPPVHVGDGLGWGSEVLFICLNDKCPVFAKGWEHVDEQYGHKASFRYMELPGSTESNVMMVGSAMAFTGSIIDPDDIKKQNKRYSNEREAVKELENCVAENNLTPVITLITDESAKPENRKKAISLLTALNSLDCIDPIRNHTFKDTALKQQCNIFISQLLENNFKKECPACKEIVKKQATKCMHCQEEFK